MYSFDTLLLLLHECLYSAFHFFHICTGTLTVTFPSYSVSGSFTWPLPMSLMCILLFYCFGSGSSVPTVLFIVLQYQPSCFSRRAMILLPAFWSSQLLNFVFSSCWKKSPSWSCSLSGSGSATSTCSSIYSQAFRWHSKLLFLVHFLSPDRCHCCYLLYLPKFSNFVPA